MKFNYLINYIVKLIASIILTGMYCYDKNLVNIHKRYNNKNVYSNYVRRYLYDNEKNHKDLTEIFGDSDIINYYYIEVLIGSHKQKSSLILDTGSSVMCLTCKNTCKKNSCGKHQFEHYNEELSNGFSYLNCNDKECYNFPTFNKCTDNKCKFSIAYGEGSRYSGVAVYDYVSFGTPNHEEKDKILFPFGCVELETNLFYTQEANGILGLSPISNTENKSAFISLAKEKGLFENAVFTLCYAKNGGYMSIGGYTYKYHKSSIQYFNYISRSGRMYEIPLKKISINNKDDEFEFIDIDNKYFTVIDSGTTLTIFPYYLKERFISKFATYCKKNDCGINYNSGSCFNLKSGVNLEDLNNKLPTISFIFSSTDKTNKNHVQINWYPSNYITPNEINSSNYCLGISGMGSNEILLGGTWMHNNDVIFDIENSRIGIAESACDSLQNIETKDSINEIENMINNYSNYANKTNINKNESDSNSLMYLNNENNKYDILKETLKKMNLDAKDNTLLINNNSWYIPKILKDNEYKFSFNELLDIGRYPKIIQYTKCYIENTIKDLTLKQILLIVLSIFLNIIAFWLFFASFIFRNRRSFLCFKYIGDLNSNIVRSNNNSFELTVVDNKSSSNIGKTV